MNIIGSHDHHHNGRSNGGDGGAVAVVVLVGDGTINGTGWLKNVMSVSGHT